MFDSDFFHENGITVGDGSPPSPAKSTAPTLTELGAAHRWLHGFAGQRCAPAKARSNTRRSKMPGLLVGIA